MPADSLTAVLRALRRAVACTLALAVLAGGFASPADAQDARARRRQVQAERAKAAARVNVLRASERELERALDVLEANVRSQEGRLANARRAATSAALQADAARRAEAEATARADELRRSVKSIAVGAYVRGTSKELLGAFEASSIAEAAARRQFLEIAFGRRTEVADELRAARQDVSEERARAEAAETQATQRAREAGVRLVELESAQRTKQRIVDDVEARLERALGEAESLAAVDRRLAQDLARRNARLAQRVQGSARARGPVRQIGRVSVTSVRGIVVATSLAGNLERLLAAAASDGIQLSGSGFRDPAGQIAVRRRNCGGSDYDVYSKPASQCRPPTARPGQSMHERGLAVDFTSGGRTLTRGSAGFRWMRANAGRFGFRNLPSEPWHWSTNGN